MESTPPRPPPGKFRLVQFTRTNIEKGHMKSRRVLTLNSFWNLKAARQDELLSQVLDLVDLRRMLQVFPCVSNELPISLGMFVHFLLQASSSNRQTVIPCTSSAGATTWHCTK